MCWQHSLGQQQQISLLQNEIDKLRSDNVKLYEKIRFLQSFPAKVLTHTYTYKVQPINSHYTNAIHTYLNTYMYLYNHTSRVTQAMHMEQRFQQICLIKNAVVLHESWLQFIFLSSHVLPRKNSWQYFGICIFESKLFYKFTKAKEATQNTQGIYNYILSASNAVNISLWPGPLSVQGGQASSEDTESRYSMQYEERLDPFSTFSRKVPPSYKYTSVDNPITNFCRKTFNYKIFINMEYDSYDILCILKSRFYFISES